MYASFADFARQKKDMRIPQHMIDYFNQQLPDLFEYERSKSNDSICYLTAKEGGKFSISGLNLLLTDRQTNMLGKNPIAPEAIDKLMRNALETVELDGSSGTLHLAQKDLPFRYLIRRVDDGTTNQGNFFIQKEPSELIIPLTCDDTHVSIHLIQKPSGSIDTVSFESERQIIDMRMDINVVNPVINYKFNFNNTADPNAKHCRDAAIIIDGMRNGKTVIDGLGAINKNPDKDDHRELAPFWNKVVEVEEALRVTFHTDKTVDKSTFANVERLHRCICEGKAVGLGFKPDSISIDTDEAIPSCEGEICRLLFPQKNDLSIFEESFTVYSNVGLEGIILGIPEQIDETHYTFPITYSNNFQCSVLYLAAKPESDAEEDVERASNILFAPLPEGKRY